MENNTLSNEQLEQIVEQLVQHALFEVQSGVIATTPFTRLAQEATRFQPGDHLISPRTGYWHHGLYVGDNQVIHYSGGSDGIGTGLMHEKFNDFKVEKVTLDAFSQKQPVRLIAHPQPKYMPQQACRRAESRLGESKYSIIYRNCEHFVNWCIEGEERSSQINRLRKTGLRLLKSIKIKRPAILKSLIKVAKKLGPNGLASLGMGEGVVGATGVNLSIFSAGKGALAGMNSAVLVGYAAWEMVDEQIKRTVAAQERAEQMHHIYTTLAPILEEAKKRFEVIAEQLLQEKQAQIDAALLDIMNDYISIEQRVDGMNRLLKVHNAEELEHSTFDDFDKAMKSDTPPIKL